MSSPLSRRMPEALQAVETTIRTAIETAKGINREQMQNQLLRALLDQMRTERCYSAYYLPCRWRNTQLIYSLAEAKRTGSPLYGKLDWAGYYLLGGRLRRD